MDLNLSVERVGKFSRQMSYSVHPGAVIRTVTARDRGTKRGKNDHHDFLMLFQFVRIKVHATTIRAENWSKELHHTSPPPPPLQILVAS